MISQYDLDQASPANEKRIIVRRFFGYRPNPPAEYYEKGTATAPNEPQYEGVVFTDGTVALRWRTQYRSTSFWNSYEDFYHVHGHPEYGTVIVWLDDQSVDLKLRQIYADAEDGTTGEIVK